MGTVQSNNYCPKNSSIERKYAAFFTLTRENSTRINSSSTFDTWENSFNFINESFMKYFSLETEELEKIKSELIDLGYTKYFSKNPTFVSKDSTFVSKAYAFITQSDEEETNVLETDNSVTVFHLKDEKLIQHEYMFSKENLKEEITKDILLSELYSKEDKDDILSKLNLYSHSVSDFTYIGNGYGILIKFYQE
jgi:hypothetical protein